MNKLFGICIGVALVASAAPAAADGVSDAKALIEKYSKLPTLRPPAPPSTPRRAWPARKYSRFP